MKIKRLKQKINDLTIGPCEAFVIIKKMIYELEELKEQIYEDATDNARGFNKGESYFGGTWEIRAGKTTYDFNQDAQYRTLNEDFKNRRKELTDACKMAATNKGFFDNDTGEQIEAVRIKSIAKDVLIFKPKKLI